MKNTARDFWLVLPLAVLLLSGSALLRGAEYDEQYTLFLTAGTARPVWPGGVFPAGVVSEAQHGVAGPWAIAAALRRTDVHPPVYFWAVALWRFVFGPGLLAARAFSVLCGVVSVGLTGGLARRFGVRPAVAMLLLLGCYGFVYTNGVARGFALAETLLLGGTLAVFSGRVWVGGVLLGAACASNYLAVFVALAVVGVAGAAWAVPAMMPFLALDGWFFLAQHGSRVGQFPPFSVVAAVVRLAGYQVAAVFGELPLYVDGVWRVLLGALVGVVAVAALVRVRTVVDWRLVVVVGATPGGLLLLGAVFDNTPVELRYLSFGLPFLAVLLGRRGLYWPSCLMLAAGVAGLLLAPATMQPGRATARAAAAVVGDGVVLVPWGNDGVGIVGAFAIEAPPALPMLLVRGSDTVAMIAAEVAGYRRVVLALMRQDAESRRALLVMRAAFAGPGWRRVANRSSVAVYERTGTGG